tara:strand:- start:53 stop:334 length:282 start_codon:yes stop_codon:yes gene_type:complete
LNAVEIEQAVSELALQPFDGDEFPYAFLVAFGNKDTTIKKLRSTKNTSDISCGVLQRSNIHIAVCAEGSQTHPNRAKTKPCDLKRQGKDHSCD